MDTAYLSFRSHRRHAAHGMRDWSGSNTHLIGNGLVLLLEEPKRWQRLCEHPEDIPLVIEEIIRFHGPVRGFMRTTTCLATVGGVSLPTGTKLFLLYSSANRDEERFSGADQFQMQRKPNHHLGFGYGVHFCVGAPLYRAPPKSS